MVVLEVKLLEDKVVLLLVFLHKVVLVVYFMLEVVGLIVMLVAADQDITVEVEVV